MPLLSDLSEIFWLLVDPWLFMFLAVQHIPLTVRNLFSAGEYGVLASPSAFADALFGTFWVTVGPMVKESGEERVVPLLQGRVRGGVVHDHVVAAPVSGTVIEVGAGSGMWADVFAKVGSSASEGGRPGLRKRGTGGGGGGEGGGLTKVYGVEPNATSAAALRQRVKDVGLEGVYEVVPVGIESLDDPTAWDGKIEPGSVDCIVCILCLCSIPEPEKNIKHLYKLLKPGGRWYVYEHVKTQRGGLLMSVYQREWPVPRQPLAGNRKIARLTTKPGVCRCRIYQLLLVLCHGLLSHLPKHWPESP